MSALLLKDYYVIFRQMKIFLLLILVFSCIPGTFYSTFAVVYASMLPYTALAYDERSRWDQMAAMMPYSARDVVLSKYLFGWIAVAVSAAATFVLQTILSVIWLSDVEGPSIPVILLSAFADFEYARTARVRGRVHPGHHPAHDVPVRRRKGAAGDVPHHLSGVCQRRRHRHH